MRFLKYAILSSTALLITAAPAAAQSQKKVITTAADVPRVQVQLPAKPSEIAINGGPQLEALETQLDAYVRDLLTNYDIQDRTTRRSLLGLQAQDALVDDRWDEYLKLSEEVAALEDKPAQRAVSGLLGRAYARAARLLGKAAHNSPIASKPSFAPRSRHSIGRWWPTPSRPAVAATRPSVATWCSVACRALWMPLPLRRTTRWTLAWWPG
jgi:hypothetical protein